MAGIWTGFARLLVPSSAGRTDVSLTRAAAAVFIDLRGSRTAEAAALLVFVSFCANLLCALRGFTMNIFP